jgi:hypothetical protein
MINYTSGTIILSNIKASESTTSEDLHSQSEMEQMNEQTN